MNLHIRWMIRRDIPEVFEIELHAAESPWSENHFVATLWRRDLMGMVADDGCQVVGFVVYVLHETHLQLLNVAVHPELQRQGIGRQIVEHIKGKPSVVRRSLITLHVRETNLVAQRFFSALGFKAESIVHECYRDTSEDAYLMVYRTQPSEPPPDHFNFANQA